MAYFPRFPAVPVYSLQALTVILSIGAVGLHGQAGAMLPQTTVSAGASKTPDVSQEALVFDKIYTHIREESDGTGTRQTTTRIRILADAGVKAMAVLTFTYTASNQQIEVAYVRVIKPDGSVVTTPDYNIQDLPADATREAPMYSDIHQKHVAVRGLGVGDVLEYQVTQKTLTAEVPGQFWLEYSFEKNLITMDEQLDLDEPADKAVTVASADVQPTVTTASGRKLYHWASSNLTRPDPDAPPKSAKNWKPSVQVTTFTSWGQVGAWYASLAKDRVTVTPAIQARADMLTKGLTTDEEKMHAIFNDVALHIHYVALNFGIGRYQPHSADDVLTNEYGDCKDKHTLLAALLKAKGIETWPVLISTSRELDAATPSPGQFDHVITMAQIEGKIVWMDSTEEVSPAGVLFASLRDKQALAVPVTKAAYLERTPADLPFSQSARLQVEGKLSDQGLFTAHFKESYQGDSDLIMRGAFRSVPQSQWKEFLQGVSNSTGFAGEVKDPQVSPIEQIDQPLEFSYDYTREKYGQWDSQQISPPLPPMGWELAPGVKQIKPADDIDIGSPGDQIYAATIQLPTGWLMFPPASTDRIEDWAEYHAKYSFKDGVFSAERRLVIKKDKVPLTDWENYLAFRRAIYDDEIVMESLVNPGQAPRGTSGSSVNTNLNAIRAELVGAITPLRDMVLTLLADPPASGDQLAEASTNASRALDAIEAKSISLPTNEINSLYWSQALALAWCVRGWTALENNDLATGENYLRAAWRLGQDQVSGYLLGRVLEARHEKIEAAHLYELAHVVDSRSVLGGYSPQDAEIRKRISDAYRRVTGKELTATSLNNGAYSGSLDEELEKQMEIKQIVHTTKLTGEGLYSLAFEADKPVRVVYLGGDKGFASLATVLQAHVFPPELPKGSKALLLREAQIICSPWAGCDASLLRPSSIQTPTQKITVIPMSTEKNSKTVRIEMAPVQ